METVVNPQLEAAEVEARRHRVFEERVASVAGVRNAADAALVGLTAEALAEGFWKGWRLHSPVQWVMWRAGVSRSTATRVVGLARRAGELPVTMAAFVEGRLSLDQAATVARYTPARFDDVVCTLAVHATVAQIVKATRRYDFDAQARLADGEGEPVPEPPAPEADRSVAFGSDEDGSWWARMHLPADEGMAFEAALKAVRDRLHDQARDAAEARAEAEGTPVGELTVPHVSWADATVGMAHAVITGGAAGAEVAARARVLMHLEIPRSYGLGDAGPSGWMGSLHLGAVLPDALRRYLTCDASVEVVWEKGTIPVNLGRTQHIVPRRIRRLIEDRDRGCRVPGCDQTWWLQIHHIIHWEDGGPTDTLNLICLCAKHHRLHHKGLLGITGNADVSDGIAFTDQNGRPMAHTTRARPPGPGEMPTVAPYACPLGERLDPDCVYFTPSPKPPEEAGRDDDPVVTTDPGPPTRRRHGRCTTTGRPDTRSPDDPRGPPPAR